MTHSDLIDDVIRAHVLRVYFAEARDAVKTAARCGVCAKTIYNYLNRWAADGHVVRDALAGGFSEAAR
jgi:transposase